MGPNANQKVFEKNEHNISVEKKKEKDGEMKMMIVGRYQTTECQTDPVIKQESSISIGD